MTKKDYKLIASRLAYCVNEAKGAPLGVPARSVIGLVAEHLADAFAMHNPRFDRARFFEDCDLADWDRDTGQSQPANLVRF